MWLPYLVVRIRHTRSAIRSGTTTSTWPGTPSAGSGQGSLRGLTTTSIAAAWQARDDLHGGRDDDGHRCASPARRDDLLRRDRPAERGGQSRARHACAEPGADI